jgi:hypothetical protein
MNAKVVFSKESKNLYSKKFLDKLSSMILPLVGQEKNVANEIHITHKKNGIKDEKK